MNAKLRGNGNLLVWFLQTFQRDEKCTQYSQSELCFGLVSDIWHKTTNNRNWKAHNILTDAKCLSLVAINNELNSEFNEYEGVILSSTFIYLYHTNK